MLLTRCGYTREPPESEKAEWKLFEDVARILEQGLGGCWKEKLDGLDQRY
jgi:hypothetical protein